MTKNEMISLSTFSLKNQRVLRHDFLYKISSSGGDFLPHYQDRLVLSLFNNIMIVNVKIYIYILSFTGEYYIYNNKNISNVGLSL